MNKDPTDLVLTSFVKLPTSVFVYPDQQMADLAWTLIYSGCHVVTKTVETQIE